MLESVLPPPSVLEVGDAVEAAPDLPTQMTIRTSVLAAWEALSDADQTLLLAIAGGLPHHEPSERDERSPHKVAVTRAVKRCGAALVQRVLTDLGLSADVASAPPRTLIEAVLEVLDEVLPRSESIALGGA